MEFRVIFSPHDEYSIETDLTNISNVLLSGLGNNFTSRKKRRLPEKSNVGIHILDLYRKKTGDYQVGINDIPTTIIRNWIDEDYVEVGIDEETARSSGRFLEYDTFYCHASFDLMKNFETVDILDENTEDPKLVLTIDKGRILKKWIEQEYPKELSPGNETELEEEETE